MDTVYHSIGSIEVDGGLNEKNKDSVPCLEESVLDGTYNSQPREKDAGKDDNSDDGYMHYGCHHYRRRCCIRAPCCNEIFDCRHCHNEAKNSIDVESSCRHQLPRHQVRQVRQFCVNCGVCMGKYFCDICKFYDDDVSKKQYHCKGCGICRTGGANQFFHCFTCGMHALCAQSP